MIIKNKGKRKEKKRKKYYEAVEEPEVDGRIAAVETGRVAKGVEERVELFVGGSTVEELEQLPAIRKLCQDACQHLMLHHYITASRTSSGFNGMDPSI